MSFDRKFSPAMLRAFDVDIRDLVNDQNSPAECRSRWEWQHWRETGQIAKGELGNWFFGGFVVFAIWEIVKCFPEAERQHLIWEAWPKGIDGRKFTIFATRPGENIAVDASRKPG